MSLFKFVKKSFSEKKVALILSGCGVADGSEIQESTACIFALSKRNISFQTYSLNLNQTQVVNHSNFSQQNENRNMLVESSRITRGGVYDLELFDSTKYNGVVIPGGFGAAKNLSSFFFDGNNMSINKLFLSKLLEIHSKKIPIASCCISPIILAKAIRGIEITLGKNDEKDWPYAGSIKVAKEFGAIVTDKDINEICIDRKNKIITTPAYMKGNATPYEVFFGIDKMIEEFNKLI